MATSGRIFRSVIGSTNLVRSLRGSTKLQTSTNLVKLIKGSQTISSSIKKRALSQLTPCLALQASRQLAVGQLSTSILDNCLVGKHTALTIAVNEAEVTSVEETDEDDEATLYILSEMFSMLTIITGDG
ncbi:uncharacterized protein [Clytia hemisphaerica]|uniref:Uncharacterized protein n=1 Tax=Clytia hemisphaerica TaxID=252671 RepID=A0A7M5X3C2_9CNID|eukprot:TCONS_00023216-protein